ncbi:hypothetical protein ACJBU6_08703 [Exserohilum turcicum]
MSIRSAAMLVSLYTDADALPSTSKYVHGLSRPIPPRPPTAPPGPLPCLLLPGAHTRSLSSPSSPSALATHTGARQTLPWHGQ